MQEYHDPNIEQPESGKRKLWKYLGIGCGVIVLLVGILLSVGAFKAVSCCGKLIDFGKQTEQAVQASLDFGTLIHQGNIEAAYELTSSIYQSRVTPSQFASGLSRYTDELQASTPFLLSLDLKLDEGLVKDDAARYWNIIIGYAQPASPEVVAIAMTLRPLTQNANHKFSIDVQGIARRTREMSAEAPAREVLKFHALLNDSRYDDIMRQFRPVDGDENSDQQLLSSIRGLASLVNEGNARITEVEYREQASARVHVIAQDMIIEYELVPVMGGLSWNISALPKVRPTMPELD